MPDEEDNANKTEIARITKSEKVSIAAIGAFSGIVGAALTYSVVAWLDYLSRDRELDLELARLALSIIAGDYSDDQGNSFQARYFAIGMLEKGTGVNIDDVSRRTWAESGTIEFGVVPTTTVAGVPTPDSSLWNGFENSTIAMIARQSVCNGLKADPESDPSVVRELCGPADQPFFMMPGLSVPPSGTTTTNE